MSASNSGDRRTFLKTTAAVGVAASVNYAGAFAAGSDVIKVGLVGCGGRGKGAVEDILRAEKIINKDSPQLEIVAVGDAFKGPADDAVKAFTNPKHTKYGPFVKQVKVTPDTIYHGLDAYQKVINTPGVNLVILATTPGFRPIHLEAAIAAGKNIFCEKPVAVDAAGARKCFELVSASKSKNLAIVAGTQRRHQKGYIETIKKVKDGAIGDIRSTRCAWNGGGIWFHARQKGESDAAYQIRNWYHFLWACGDHIVEQHVHNLDVINWVMGDHPVKAIGMGGRAARPGGTGGDPNEFGQIWDHYAVEYEYKNGVKLYSYCRHLPGDSDVSETVVGSTGVCNTRDGGYMINKTPCADDGNSRAYVQEHVDLLNSIRGGKPLNELQNVTESTFTAILGRNASYACRSIKWDDALAANEDLMPKNLTMDMALKVGPAPTPGSWKLPGKA